jgi:membrane associated rhomboid family serine protease
MEPEENQTAGVLVRETRDFTQAQDWSTVLAAAGITHELRTVDGAFRIAVAFVDLDAAANALEAFDREARQEREEQAARVPDEPERPRSQLGLWATLLLVSFYLVAGAWEAQPPSRWFTVGTASADAIMHGQWWRAITALTLHANLPHLLGNVVATLLFVSAVGRALGPGLGALTIVAASAGANLLTAAVHRTRYLSVGASTATFAALGIVAGIAAWRRWRVLPQRRRAWLPIAAGLGLFAMLGVGQSSDSLFAKIGGTEPIDVFAHLFGLAVGCLFGIITARLFPRRPGQLVQGVLVGGALAMISGCWWLAFHHT